MSCLIEILMIIPSNLAMIFLSGADKVLAFGVFVFGIVWLYTIDEIENVIKEVPENKRLARLLFVLSTGIGTILILQLLVKALVYG